MGGHTPRLQPSEYCGRPDYHPYEPFIQLKEIEHRTTKVRRPQSNGFIERSHRTLSEDQLQGAGPDKVVRGAGGEDLDTYLVSHITKPPR